MVSCVSHALSRVVHRLLSFSSFFQQNTFLSGFANSAAFKGRSGSEAKGCVLYFCDGASFGVKRQQEDSEAIVESVRFLLRQRLKQMEAKGNPVKTILSRSDSHLSHNKS